MKRFILSIIFAFGCTASVLAQGASTSAPVVINGVTPDIGATPGYCPTIDSAGHINSVTCAAYNVMSYGLKCDGTTDDTSALNTLLTTVYNAGGGQIFFPTATNPNGCLISGQIVLPNDNAAVPQQPSLRLFGAGFSAAGQGFAVPTGGSILTMTYAGSVAKLVSYGIGALEIDHLVFRETNAGTTTPFVFDSNTTLHAHDNAFFGAFANAGTANVQDVFVLGGTGTSSTGNATGWFQGYGTVIENNFADHIRRLAFLQSAANNVVIANNTVWAHSGSNLTNGAAIDITTAGSSSQGNYVTGNLVEVTGYPYAYRDTANTSYFVGNGTWDVSGVTQGAYYLSGGGGRVVIDGHDDFTSGNPFTGAASSDIIVAANGGGAYTSYPHIFSQTVQIGAQLGANCYNPNFGSNASGSTLGICFSQDGKQIIFNAYSGGVGGSVLGAGIYGPVMPSTSLVEWFNGTNMVTSTVDLGLARNAAGVMEINNGTPGTYRDFQARNESLSSLVGTGSRPVCVTSAGVLEAGSLTAGLVTCP